MPTNTPVNPNQPLGGLYVESPSGEKLVFPLKHTEVHAKIAGNLSRVEVTQSFENPFAQTLEAIYIFPLPDEAAVDDMEIKIGDRIIKGSIKQREEAQQIYQQAKREGRTAGLLEQERDNIFTQSLANIQPGEQIDVTIRYTDSLKFEGGNYEFIFPMVVAPRYIPGTQIDNSGDTDRVPDASRISPPVMPSGMRSGHDIGVTVEIDAGSIVSDVSSTSHQLRIDREGQIVRIKLGGEDTIPNKDLILCYQVAGANTQATILKQSNERGGHFAVYLIPALAYKPTEIVPKDVVFLMDTSGSQSGEPIRQSQELMRRFINGLNPHDTFTIIDFANTATYLSAAPLANTPENRTKAINYIDRLTADGGTELMNGIHAVINFPDAPAGRLRSIVLITDGYIGNDNEILAAVQQHLKPGNRQTFNLIFDQNGNPAIAQLWGRSRIKDLMLQMLDVETKIGVEAVTETALTYQLLSQYTAFVAVSDDVRVNPAENFISMQVPVEMPESMISGSLGGFAYNAPAPPSLMVAMPSSIPSPPHGTAYLSQASDDWEDRTTGAAPGGSLLSAPAKNIFAKATEAISQIFGKNQPVEAKEVDEETGSQNTPAANNYQLEVVSVTGLDPAGVLGITQYLQQLKLPTGFSGVIVFEFTINKGRVGRIVLDEEASTLLAKAVVEVIKRSLTSWNSPQSANETVRLTLRIK